MKYWDKNGIVCKINIINPNYEAISKYYNKVNSKKSSTRRWVLFEDIITGNG